MRTKTLEFLDKMAEQGETRISLTRLKVELINKTDIGRNEVKAYMRYLIDSGLVKGVGGEFFEFDNDLRLNLRREADAKDKYNDLP